jgi:chloride channel protein, CIC family
MTQGLPRNPVEGERGLVVLALLALAAGAAVGLVGACFRLALEHVDRWREALISWAHGEMGGVGLLLLAATCGVAVSVAAWLVRRYAPHASGSGIPHVEAVLTGEIPQAPFRLVPVKFVGGLLAIGSGLALGREGPSVQMGASIAHLIGQACRRSWPECRELLAAGAGAGLATAFNAPMAGAVFVMEELVKRFETRVAIAALAASATAMAVGRVLLGDAPDFHVPALIDPSAAAKPLFFVLGAVCGFVAIAYNRTLLGTLGVMDRFTQWPLELRAGLIGAAVGMLAWFAPSLVGGGDPLTQRALDGAEALSMLPLLFAVRFGLGAASYAAGTPGGLFAPVLVLGAQLGLAIGLVCRLVFPHLDVQAEGFAMVGMAAFFTGVVRAPLTGIVLVTEMTGSVALLLPTLGACSMAMLVPTLLRDDPVYDSLRERTLHKALH